MLILINLNIQTRCIRSVVSVPSVGHLQLDAIHSSCSWILQCPIQFKSDAEHNSTSTLSPLMLNVILWHQKHSNFSSLFSLSWI